MRQVFYIESPYLEHHGIKGQKWGIRRYQNADGSLTWLGRRRVHKALEQRNTMLTTKDERDRRREEKKFRKMTNKMTPAEVEELIARVEKDEKLRTLNQVKQERDKIEKGLSYANKFAELIGTSATTATKIAGFAGVAAAVTATRQQLNDPKKYPITKSDIDVRSGKMSVSFPGDGKKKKGD